MKPSFRLSLAGFALAAVAALAMAPAVQAQTSSVRTPADVSGVRAGLVCDIAAGWAMSTTSNGTLTCTQNVNTSNTAVNATNAQTAVTATTATQAQSLNPNAQVNASQISGVLAPANIPAGSGGGGGTAALSGCTHPGNGSYYASGGGYTACESWSAESGNCNSYRTFVCSNGSWS